MNIQIRPGAATEDARQIDHIIEQITENMATLNDAIKKNIPAGINTEWSDRVRSDWEKYYNESIPATNACISCKLTFSSRTSSSI